MLYNYSGTKYSMIDVMGTFTMTSTNEIALIQSTSKRGTVLYRDLSGHLVNNKGYLVDAHGNIVDRSGKIIWHKHHLKNSEFPKFFSFSKLDLKLIQGRFNTGPDNKPILKCNPSGGF